MKRIFIFLVILSIMCTFVACSSDKESNENTNINETVNLEQNEETTKTATIESYIDSTFETKISFKIPEKFNDKFVQKTQSSFSNGYYSITICVKDTEYDLFTVYCTKNDDFKSLENNKGYTILDEKDGYTFVWYEYGHETVDGTKLPEIIKEFETEYKNIKSSFSVE